MIPLILGVLLQIAPQSPPPRTPTTATPPTPAAYAEPDWDWLETARPVAFNILMPVRPRTGEAIAYRRYRDFYHDAPELYFRIEFNETGTAFGVLLTPTGRSIQEQLLDQHARDGRASVQAAVEAVNVRRVVVSARQCPELAKRIAALSDLKIVVPRPNTLELHPVLHRLVVDTLVLDIDATIKDPESPLVQWANLTAATIQICGDR